MPATVQAQGVATLAYPCYAVLPGDLRPTPEGEDATLFEIGTGRVFVWRDRQWHLFNQPAPDPRPVLEAILHELRALKRGVELALGTELPTQEM